MNILNLICNTEFTFQVELTFILRRLSCFTIWIHIIHEKYFRTNNVTLIKLTYVQKTAQTNGVIDDNLDRSRLPNQSPNEQLELLLIYIRQSISFNLPVSY